MKSRTGHRPGSKSIPGSSLPGCHRQKQNRVANTDPGSQALSGTLQEHTTLAGTFEKRQNEPNFHHTEASFSATMDYTQSPYLIRVFDFDLLHMEVNTPLFILALVLLVMFFMNIWLFRPVLRTLENRRKLLEDLRTGTEQHRQEFDKLSAGYQRNLEDMRADVAQVRQDGHRDTQAAVEAILTQARQAAAQEFETSLQALKEETETARRQLMESAGGLAEQVTSRVIAQ